MNFYGRMMVIEEKNYTFAPQFKKQGNNRRI